MRRNNTEQARLFQIAALCEEAVAQQRERECRLGYGLDDYTEGRIVGAANLARKIRRVLTGGVDPAATSLPRR